MRGSYSLWPCLRRKSSTESNDLAEWNDPTEANDVTESDDVTESSDVTDWLGETARLKRLIDLMGRVENPLHVLA